MNEDKPTRGRGRPKGANSFALVRMSDLEEYLGPNAVIKVSKIWLKEIGLTLDEPVATIAPVTEEKEETPIEFSLTTFED